MLAHLEHRSDVDMYIILFVLAGLQTSEKKGKWGRGLGDWFD